jgi:uncharacterized membrane protein YagU involved in acid resistance
MQLSFEKIENLIENLKCYAVTTVDLFKLETADRFSTILSKLISNVIIWLTVVLFSLFLSLCISFFLSDIFDNSYIGFGIVAGFYLLLLIALIVFRKKILIRPIRDRMIQEIMQSKKTK